MRPHSFLCHPQAGSGCRYRQLPKTVVWPGAQAGVPVPDDVLKLGLLLPVSGSWKAGRTIAGAAALAVQRINDDAGLLGGMRVEYVWVDSGFTVAAGNEAVAKLLANKDIDAVFGPGADRRFSALLRCCWPARYDTLT